MADELRHLARHEKKNLVRGRNSVQVGVAKQQQELPNQQACNSSSDGGADLLLAADHQLEANDRLLQWLREDIAPPSAVFSHWEAQFRDQNQLYDEKALEEEATPLTSGQVKHAYRTRARRQETQDAKRVVEMKVKREILLGLQNSRAQTVVVSRPKASHQKNIQVGSLIAKPTRTTGALLPQVKTQIQPLANSDEQGQQKPQDSRVLELKNLPASRICVDSEYHNETLVRIRRQLISGRDVLLASDCSSEGENLSDTKLMVQQPCAQSLMYCVRGQEVVPRVELSLWQVELLLRTRIPPS